MELDYRIINTHVRGHCNRRASLEECVSHRKERTKAWPLLPSILPWEESKSGRELQRGGRS